MSVDKDLQAGADETLASTIWYPIAFKVLAKSNLKSSLRPGEVDWVSGQFTFSGHHLAFCHLAH